ncbi:hypothetical protein MSC49_31730 [Methylosinus sp. C49]|uniref:glycosyltransferase family 4 protein n=1 Tax=Methylosinus sp. C49 TaxID=2699395 RepID=UPI001366D76A|nr:glycosyltransferase family 4 protein [Methylosinus sp. C49]BBU63238.1 hypothetical protein MSC49_31730 [Methylosinus sp. C49]
MTFKVDIWHNILWSKYKGAVFGEVHREAVRRGIEARFFQIAETENDRRGLGEADRRYHKYPYDLIWDGSYQDIPIFRLVGNLFLRVLRSDADLVVIAGYHKIEYWAQLIAARLVRKKVMVFCDSTYFDNPRHPIKDFLKKTFFRHCDGFFSYGQRSMQYLVSYGVPTHKIFLRCQAAALTQDYDPQIALDRRIAALRRGANPVILYVGRLAPEKNLPLLLQAFGALAKDDPRSTLKLVGEGPERKALELAAESMALSARVVFAGGLSGQQLFDEYVNAACLVLPSSSEPWGLVVNEALSYGCPVVVSDHCGCAPDLVLEGTTGFRFSTFDVASLEAKLRAALAPGFANDGVARACVQLMGNFTPERAASAIVAGLERVAERTAQEAALSQR